jgi:hypothetical protein
MRFSLPFPTFLAASLCLGGVFFHAPASIAAEPLHTRIDALLEKGQPAGQATLATDAEFLRRATLALHGTIPSADQARAFLADKAPDKRAKLIDALLADRQYARWMAVRFDIMLMERRAETHTKVGPWREWLEESFAANRSWDALVRDLFSNDGSDEKTRHLARWTLERDGDQNALTKDVGRLILGQDISCAQCHDHPRVDDYLQRDYAGIQAFFNRTYLFRPDNKKPGVLGEQATGDLSYLSVFTKASGVTRPRLPGQPELAEPNSTGEWAVAPNPKDKNLRPIPKYSRRALLADTLATGAHPQFRRNIANRLWSVVFGRGLVEPLDMDHSGNPASHPELLALLADEVGAMKFDMRAFIRELALTRAFQRSLDLPAPAPAEAAKLAARMAEAEKRAAEQEKASAAATEAFRAAQKSLLEANLAATPLLAEVTKGDADIAAAQKAVDEALKTQKPFDDKVVAPKKQHEAALAGLAKASEAIAKSDKGETPKLVAAKKAAQFQVDAAAKAFQAAESAAAAKRAVTAEKNKALADAKARLDAAKVKLTEANKAVAARQTTLDDAAKKKEAARVLALNSAQAVTETRAAIAWHQAQPAKAPASGAQPKADPAIDAAKAKLAPLETIVTDNAHALAPLEAVVVAAQAVATEAQKAATAKTPALASLKEAADKAQAAAAQFPEDAELKQAAATLKTRHDTVAAALTDLAKIAGTAKTSADAAAKRLAAAKAAQSKAKTELAAVEAQLTSLAATAAPKPAAPSNADEAREALATAWSRSFAAMDLVPLTPEQLTWSILQSTGQIDAYRTAAYAEWDKKNKFTEADKANAAKMKEREAAVYKTVRDKSSAQEGTFVRFFGGAPGQPQTDFFATPEQALFFENGGTIRALTNTLVNRAAALPDPKAMAEELYLTTLTRLPDAAEVADLAAALGKRPVTDKSKVLGDAAWALLSSVEFRFAF